MTYDCLLVQCVCLCVCVVDEEHFDSITAKLNSVIEIIVDVNQYFTEM